MLLKSLLIEEFQYDLPHDRIAQYPKEDRDGSKLLVYKQGIITDASFRNITDYIPENSTLVFNNTKVIRARLLFKTNNDKAIEIFCLEPASNIDVSVSMASSGSAMWKCLIGGAAKWKEEFVYYESNGIIVKAKIVEKVNDIFTVELTWAPDNLSFSEILQSIGNMPIPPYLNRTTESIDAKRYQTVYSKTEGSVAAPTAGLHFTQYVLEELKLKGNSIANITLHVGAGTFKPVKTNDVRDHIMHAELIDVDLETIQQLSDAHQNTIIAVGTTSLRTIETLYWLGVKLINHPEIQIDNLNLLQWEVYEMKNDGISSETALNALIDYLIKHKLLRLITKTSILIVPGYQLRLVKALITNFHQPESTLMLLVATVVGHDWKKIYTHALENDYRFLSYGDSSLLFAK